LERFSFLEAVAHPPVIPAQILPIGGVSSPKLIGAGAKNPVED